ncbi:MAG: xanthine dehydrogenase accessory protein XdhC [Phycisphaerales bacterium]
MSLSVLQTASQLIAEGRAFVLATVVSAEGRTPRDAGARMIWLPGGDGPATGRIIGTIGGGGLEQAVIEACARRFAARSAGTERVSLLQDADQCCGGAMEVFLEYVGPSGRVVIFGAGHVSLALVGLLRESPLEIVVVDNREEWNSAERFGGPRCRRVHDWREGVAIALEKPAETSACIMTYEHDTDFEILRSLLAAEGAALPAYVGLIGSRSKRACFWGRLSASGVEAARVERVECPMGLGDMGKSPLEVAVSIAGRLLLEARARARVE